ncbi:fibrinogen C domain-containing protein 1-A-like [Littorina saxatilis]|uniref:Fibrinogen C-terminal domain-containing protein n=1 Tax=Littorina saxatilis TaxID=31220 RepID=A0AAN9APM3_9CAEN
MDARDQLELAAWDEDDAEDDCVVFALLDQPERRAYEGQFALDHFTASAEEIRRLCALLGMQRTMQAPNGMNNQGTKASGDSLSRQRGQQFSTKDKDHDKARVQCAQDYHGAWWYNGCHDSNLNADYKTSSSAPYMDGMSWRTFGIGGYKYSMKFTEMKIRPI